MEHESVIINVFGGWPVLNVLFVWPTVLVQWGSGVGGEGRQAASDELPLCSALCGVGGVGGGEGGRQQVMNCRSARREVGLGGWGGGGEAGSK